MSKEIDKLIKEAAEADAAFSDASRVRGEAADAYNTAEEVATEAHKKLREAVGAALEDAKPEPTSIEPTSAEE